MTHPTRTSAEYGSFSRDWLKVDSADVLL